jgi:preprotein translocase subunit SecY
MGVLDIMQSIAKKLPTINSPSRPPTVKERLIWTGLGIILFFMLYQTTVLGVNPKYGTVDFLSTITASRVGSLLTTGIGPIVLASIFLQLFVGAKLIKLNLQDKHDKEKFHEAQKVLGIFLAIAEAAIFVFTSRMELVMVFGTLTPVFVIIQIALGSIILMYLDEIITKYGIGSGISLFIAAGVALAVVGGLIGLIFAQNGVIDSITSGGAEGIPTALKVLLPFVFTVIVFLIVVYAEGIKVEIPISYERVKGMAPKLPLKLFYVSNIPVIFASALLLNVQLFGAAVLPKATDFESVKSNPLAYLGVVDSSNQLRDGLLYMVSPLYAGRGTEAHWNYITTVSTPVFGIPEWLHAITYMLFLAFASVLFGMFWVETAGMDAKSMSEQLSSSGFQIPGFRRDPRMLETILGKYIFPLTVTGSFLVGLLAGLADFTGALGTGTGILLTVGILYKMYEQMEQMKMFELYPALGNML